MRALEVRKSILGEWANSPLTPSLTKACCKRRMCYLHWQASLIHERSCGSNLVCACLVLNESSEGAVKLLRTIQGNIYMLLVLKYHVIQDNDHPLVFNLP